ncbi:HNH endonuclease, partial [Neisseria meningitidis]|nr:HNH endonuclease [Neisseria meningitidis]
LDKAAENLGPAGKAAVNALGGAAIGYATGGSGGAVVGANVDWNNRQLHDSEIRKIKNNAAKFAKLHPGISQRQAEERLVAQAMRQVDAAYYAKHADTDT